MSSLLALGWEAMLTLGVVLSMLVVLVFTRLPVDAVFLGGLGVLLVSGVLDAASALSGFSAPGMITIGVLYVVVEGLQDTGGLAWISHHVLGYPRGARRALFRMLAPVVGLSAFLNNTPVVAMFIPVVTEWCRRLRLSPSRLLIPLSYASIFGGICTLIGTSTNLVVNTMVQSRFDSAGLGMFEISKLGVPCALAGMAYLVLFSHRLLPDRKSATDVFENPREYTLELEVAKGSPLAGDTIQRSGLRHLPGAFLAELVRDGQVLSAVSPSEVLQEGDRLVFVGNLDSMKTLHNQRGLIPATGQVFKLDAPRHQRCLVEAVVSDTCPLAGKTIREGRFRTVYNAVVIAAARNGERLQGKIGDIELRAGDMLLVESHAGFISRQKDSRDFYLISGVEDSTPKRFEKAPWSFAVLVGMVALVCSGLLSMLQAAMLAAGAMMLLRCSTVAQARKSVEWNVLIVIASAIGIGMAVERTGLAAFVAEKILSLVHGHAWGALAAVYLLTSLFTGVIGNNAAAVLVFPVAMSAVDHLGVNPMPFIGCIMIAASSNFATPVSYQTNLMVYSPGGYRFVDYLKIGIPLNLLFGVIAVVVAPVWWPF